jgi:hypothetical protein
MSAALTGHCHCGAIRVVLEPGAAVADLSYRACQCGFCRRHGAATTSDPRSFLHIEAAPGALKVYRFGHRTVDALICDECGVYVASSIEVDGRRLATLNVTGVQLDAFAGRTPEPVSHDDEDEAARLARRKARWTPTMLVETQPSA